MTFTWALKEESAMQRSSIQERTASAKVFRGGGKRIQKEGYWGKLKRGEKMRRGEHAESE